MNTESIIKKYKLDTSDWTFKGFHGVLHTFFPVGETGVKMQDIFGDTCSITLYCIKNDYVYWYWNDVELKRLRETFFERIKNDPKYFDDLIEKWEKEIVEFEKVILKVQKIDLTKLTDENLINLYKDFYNHYLNQFKYFMALGDAVGMYEEQYLIPEFQKVLDNLYDEIFPKLIVPDAQSFIEEEYQDRKKLIKIKKERGDVPQELLVKHAQKYFYIHNNYAKAERLTPKEVRKSLDEKILQKKKISQVDFKDITLTSWQETLVKIVRKFFHIQDTRKKYVLISNTYQFDFLREAERRTKIPFKLLQYSIFPEYQKIISNKYEGDFKDRTKMCVAIHTPNNYEILTGDKARQVFDFFVQERAEENDVTGVVASTGKTKGVVKIIQKTHDLENMANGNILVTSMTRPEMIVAMKKAAGIVTDEGGITSHAAIVSRELGIPCVIGTKIATKIFKDGDIVEVDAEKGIVKKINK